MQRHNITIQTKCYTNDIFYVMNSALVSIRLEICSLCLIIIIIIIPILYINKYLVVPIYELCAIISIHNNLIMSVGRDALSCY